METQQAGRLCRLPSDAASIFPAGGGSFDGYAELWFDDVEAVRRAFHEPRYLEVIRPDEPKFADLASSVVSITEEVVIHGGQRSS